MADEEKRQAEIARQPRQQVDDLRLERHVEGRDGLVGDQHLGLHGEGAGEADALPLAAGDLVRETRPISGPRPTRVRSSAMPPPGARREAAERERLAEAAGDDLRGLRALPESWNTIGRGAATARCGRS